jgi:glycosyltransferase involved in cell wall biosynthesis
MKLSVVVPVYNEEKFIAVCLDSLLNQEEMPDEIIVVDNNSTDRTIPIAKRFGVRVVIEKKQGMSYARNAGFDAATGEIIARCDADSHVPPDWIKRIKDAFRKDGIEAVGGPLCYGDSKFARKYTTKAVNLHAKTYRTLQHNEVLYGPNMALTKSVWNKIRGELNMDNTQVHEDMDTANHIAKYGKIKFDPKLLVYTSNRRIRKNPASFFIEYPIRMIKTMNVDPLDTKTIRKISDFIFSDPE